MWLCRYARPPLRQAAPELRRALVELQCDLDDDAPEVLTAKLLLHRVGPEAGRIYIALLWLLEIRLAYVWGTVLRLSFLDLPRRLSAPQRKACCATVEGVGQYGSQRAVLANVVRDWCSPSLLDP